MPITINGTTGISGNDGSAGTPTLQGTDTNTGIFFPAADTIAFAEGGVEAMRLDANGNLLVGTTSAGAKLHVYGTGSTYAKIQSVNAFTGAGLYFENNTRNWLIGAGPASGASEFQFFDVTAGAERARIDSSGNLLVGTTSQLASTSFASFSTGNGWVMGIRNTANSSGINITNGSGTAGYSAIGFYNNGLSYSSCGTVTVSGTTTTYGTSSDYRMKENVQPMVGALARVAALKPVTYTWKSTGEEGEGFIAHELQEVCPSAVVGEKDAVDEEGKIKPQNIDTSFLVATLTAAIQELKAIVDAQAVEIAQLKGQA